MRDFLARRKPAEFSSALSHVIGQLADTSRIRAVHGIRSSGLTHP